MADSELTSELRQLILTLRGKGVSPISSTINPSTGINLQTRELQEGTASYDVTQRDLRRAAENVHSYRINPSAGLDDLIRSPMGSVLGRAYASEKLGGGQSGDLTTDFSSLSSGEIKKFEQVLKGLSETLTGFGKNSQLLVSDFNDLHHRINAIQSSSGGADSSAALRGGMIKGLGTIVGGMAGLSASAEGMSPLGMLTSIGAIGSGIGGTALSLAVAGFGAAALPATALATAGVALPYAMGDLNARAFAAMGKYGATNKVLTQVGASMGNMGGLLEGGVSSDFAGNPDMDRLRMLVARGGSTMSDTMAVGMLQNFQGKFGAGTNTNTLANIGAGYESSGIGVSTFNDAVQKFSKVMDSSTFTKFAEKLASQGMSTAGWSAESIRMMGDISQRAMIGSGIAGDKEAGTSLTSIGHFQEYLRLAGVNSQEAQLGMIGRAQAGIEGASENPGMTALLYKFGGIKAAANPESIFGTDAGLKMMNSLGTMIKTDQRSIMGDIGSENESAMMGYVFNKLGLGRQLGSVIAGVDPNAINKAIEESKHGGPLSNQVDKVRGGAGTMDQGVVYTNLLESQKAMHTLSDEAIRGVVAFKEIATSIKAITDNVGKWGNARSAVVQSGGSVENKTVRATGIQD